MPSTACDVFVRVYILRNTLTCNYAHRPPHSHYVTFGFDRVPQSTKKHAIPACLPNVITVIQSSDIQTNTAASFPKAVAYKASIEVGAKVVLVELSVVEEAGSYPVLPTRHFHTGF